MSIVLITGSCGLVGSDSVKFFVSKGFDVIGIDNNLRLRTLECNKTGIQELNLEKKIV